VIESAADRQMAHVRLHQNGPHGEASQRLLNEISAAKVCLLDSQRKAAYDQRLQAPSQIKKATKLIVAKPLEPITAAISKAAPATAPLPAKLVDDTPATKSKAGFYLSLAVVGAALLVVGIGVIIMRARGATTEVAEAETNTDVSTGDTPGSQQVPAVIDSTTTPDHHAAHEKSQPPVVPPVIVPPVIVPLAPVEEKGNTPATTSPTAASSPITDPAETSSGLSTNDGPATTDEIAAPDQLAQADSPEISDDNTAEAADDRSPLPSADARRKKLEQVEGLFAISEARTPAAKRELAGKLFETAQETREDPAARFVLLNLARELASGAGDLDTALAAVDELNAEFQIDADAVRIASFDGAAKVALPNAARESAVERGNEYVDELLGRDKYLEAAKLIQTLQIVARPLRDRELMNALADRRNRGSTLYKQYQKSSAAMAALEKNPADADANLAAGRFYAFAKGQWERGLPLLAKGSDAKLKEIAEQEIGMPAAAAEQSKLADAWWEAAQGGSGIEADRQLARARMWYELAAAKLSGLDKVQAQKRIESLRHVALDGGEPLAQQVARNDPPDESPFGEIPDDTEDPSPSIRQPEDKPSEPPLELAVDDKLPKGGVLRLGTRRLTHAGGVDRLFALPDGQSAVTIGGGRIQKWSLRDGASVFSDELINEEGRARIEFDGQRFALIATPLKNGLNTQDFRVVDLAAGKDVAKFTHKGWSNSCAISPGGELVALGNIDRSVTLLDPHTGEVLETLPNDGMAEQPQVSFSRSGAVLAIRSGPVVRFFSIEMRSQLGEETATVRQDGVWELVLSHEGDKAALVKNGETIIFSTKTGDAVKLIKHPAPYSVLGPKLSPDGKWLAMWIFDYRVVILDVASGTMVKEIPTGRSMIRELDFTSDSRKLMGSLAGGRLLLWDLATGKELSLDPTRDMTDAVVAVAISPDGRNIASADRKGYVTLWSNATRWRAEPMPNDGLGNLDPMPTPDFLQFAGGGRRLIAGSCNRRGTVNVWDVASRDHVARLEGHGWPVMSVAVHDASGLIASTGRDGSLRLWNAGGTQLKTIEKVSGCIDFSPDGKLIAVASWHNENQNHIQLYDPATGGLVKRLEGHTFSTCDVSFSPDGRRIVSTSRDKTMRIWDTATGECKHVIALPSETRHVDYGAKSVAHSPRGDMIASTASDGGVYLWTPEGEAIATLRGHEGEVQCLAWRSDGKQLVSGGADNSVMVWDVAKAVPK
jgi:WD40 repeat protein